LAFTLYYPLVDYLSLKITEMNGVKDLVMAEDAWFWYRSDKS
jgi:hypothetical protein